MKFPYFSFGTVVKGFGRGSKQLGIPTANFPNEVVDQLPSEYKEGVYYGYAQVNDGPIYKMVMSVGRNPYFKNEKRTMETYIIHKFDNDFYGESLKILVLGYIRPMSDYTCLDDLIAAIHSDIKYAEDKLDDDYKNYKLTHNDNNNNFNISKYFMSKI